MTKAIFFIMSVLVGFQCLNLVCADEVNFLTLRYDILSEQNDVGDMTLKISKKNNHYLLVENNHIFVSGWWGEIDVTGLQTEKFTVDGHILDGDYKMLDGENAYWASIKADAKDVYLGSTLVVKKISSHDRKLFNQLSTISMEATQSTIESLPLLAQKMFTQEHSKVVQKSDIAKTAFDATMNSLSFFLQQNSKPVLPTSLNILDIETLDIKEYKVTDLGFELITVGTQRINAQHIKLSASHSKPIDLWINAELFTFPSMIRLIGTDDDGHYQIELKLE